MSELVLAVLVAMLAVIACLALARALPEFWARRSMSRAGLHLPARDAVAAVASIDGLALDKHRTLTTGQLEVVSVDPVRSDAERDLRWFAGALEHHADDSVGRAIARLATRGRVTDVEHVAGIGISGAVDRHPVRVGLPSWIGVDVDEAIGTTLAVEVDARYMGSITVADEIDPRCGADLARLRACGVEPLLLTGDTAITAKDLAARTGIGTVVAGVAEEARSDAERRLTIDRPATAFLDAGATRLSVGDVTADLDPRARPLAAVASSVAVARAVPLGRRRALVCALIPLAGVPLALAPAGWLWAAAAAAVGLVGTTVASRPPA